MTGAMSPEIVFGARTYIDRIELGCKKWRSGESMVHGTLRVFGHNMAAHGVRTLPAGPLVNNSIVLTGLLGP